MRKAFFFMSIVFALSVCAEGLNKIIAKVNNEAITLRDLDEYVKMFSQQDFTGDFRGRILEYLIEQKLIEHVAKENEVEVSDDWVQAQLNQLIAQYKDYEEFEQDLIKKGLSVNALREKIRREILVRQAINTYVNSRVVIFPKEITDYYNNNIEEFSAPTTYICWITKSNKESFLEQVGDEIVNDGIDAVIEKHKDIFFRIESDETGLKTEVKEVVTKIQEDQFRIREIEGAYYLIYLRKIVPPYQKFIEGVKDQIHEILWKEKFEQQFQEWINELKEQAVIKYYD